MIKKVNPATVDRIVYSFIGIFFVWILLTLDYSKSNLWVVLTFLLIGGFSFYQIIISEKNITLKRIFYVFVFIFMFFAPLQQYLSGTVLWKSTGAKLWYSDQEYLYANLLISLFLLLFERSYEVAEYRDKPKNPMFQPVDTARSSAYKFTVVVLNVVSVLVCVWLLVSGNILGRAGIDFISFKNLSDQIVRILRYFPVCCLLFSVSLWQIKKIRYPKSVFLYAVESLFIYFPFYGSVSRFLLFGAYLSVGSLFFYRFRYNSVYFLRFVVGFFIVFSAFNFFKTHTLSEWYKFSLEIVDFKTPDYDAYQIFMATVKYTALKGVCWGKNLLTAIACMIPRRVWGSKMLPSGEVVLRYFQSNFTNVSCPWFAEFYFAFGSWGVLLGAIVTGFLCKYFDGFYDRGSVFLRSVFCVLTGLFIYILRGALLSAFSYTVALLVPLVLIYLTEKFFLFFVKRREKIEG